MAEASTAVEQIAEELGEFWWALALRGVASIGFGILALVQTGLTLAVLIMFIGAWFLVDGVFTLVHGFKADKRWPHFVYGALGIIAGLATFFAPGLTAIVMIFVVATWLIVKGVLEVSMAVRLRKEIEGEWLLGLVGLASIVFGAILFVTPATGLLAVMWIIGAYAIAFGVLLIILGFRLRSFKRAA